MVDVLVIWLAQVMGTLDIGIDGCVDAHLGYVGCRPGAAGHFGNWCIEDLITIVSCIAVVL